MNVILLTATTPKSLSPNKSQDLLRFLSDVKDLAKDNPDIEILSDSAISVRGAGGLYPLSKILVAAHELNYPYSVRFFGSEKTWACDAE